MADVTEKWRLYEVGDKTQYIIRQQTDHSTCNGGREEGGKEERREESQAAAACTIEVGWLNQRAIRQLGDKVNSGWRCDKRKLNL